MRVLWQQYVTRRRAAILAVTVLSAVVGVLIKMELPSSGPESREALRLGGGRAAAGPLTLSAAAAMANSSAAQLEDVFYRHVGRVHARCGNVLRVPDGDDGDLLCQDRAFALRRRRCSVLSFGAEDPRWPFEEAVAIRFGCAVELLDPLLGMPSQLRLPGPVQYTAAPADAFRNATVDRFLPRAETDVVRLTLDPADLGFVAGAPPAALRRVKQLILNLRTQEVNDVPSGREDYLRYIGVLATLTDAGFRAFAVTPNEFCAAIFQAARQRNGSRATDFGAKSSCYALSFINALRSPDVSGN